MAPSTTPSTTPQYLPYATIPIKALSTVWQPPCGLIHRYPTGTATSNSCYPPGFNDYWVSSASVVPYYSPGICPLGYTLACPVSVLGSLSPGAKTTETAVLCAPTGYTCVVGDPYYAWSDNGAAATLAMFIQVRWAETDLPALETNPLTPAIRTTLAEQANTGLPSPPLSTTTTTSLPGAPSGNPSISPPAIIGISFSVLGVLLLGITIPIFFGQRRRWADILRRRKRDSRTVSPPPIPHKAELDGKAIRPKVVSELPVDPEADAGVVSELAVELQHMIREPKGLVTHGDPSRGSTSTEHEPNRQKRQSYYMSPATLYGGDARGSEELESLLEQRAQIANRIRMLELQQLEEEDLKIRRRISELAELGGSPHDSGTDEHT